MWLLQLYVGGAGGLQMLGGSSANVVTTNVVTAAVSYSPKLWR